MTRDTGLEARLLDDPGDIGTLDSRPMFGGPCFLLNRNMLCATGEGRAMFRLGKTAEAEWRWPMSPPCHPRSAEC